MSGESPILAAESLRFGYRPDEPVLRGIHVTAHEGRLLCVLGPNGSGKTTLLRCLLGQLEPTGGTVQLAGRLISDYRPRELARTLAYVPQTPTSAFDFSAGEIVLMGRLAHTGALGLTGKDDRQVAHLAMEMTDTVRFGERTLNELSGGEAQRVMVARALAQQPSVMLLDEPTSHLDIRHQITIYRMMARLAHDWKMAVICVSHDVNLAARFADELVLMKDGTTLAAGTPDEVVREDVLSQAYDVSVKLIDLPDGQGRIARAH
ncbi:MAG: ABC transporter ATP-binding protein [Planctomycetota bacterium]|jgi:iron complex transport system ATP-binding protein